MTSSPLIGRVLHVTPSFARSEGGPSEVLRRLLPALKTVGWEPALIATDKGLASGERAPIQQSVIAPHAGNPRLTFSRKFPGLLRDAHARYDVVHLHSVSNFVSSSALHVLRNRLESVVVQPHGFYDQYHLEKNSSLKKSYAFAFETRHLAQVANFVVSSEREHDDLRRAVPSAKPVTVPLSVDDDLFRRALSPRKPRSILFLGRIAHKKRLDVVLAAMARPALADFSLTVAGPLGSDLDYSPRELAAQLDVADRVNFVGPVDAHRRRVLLQSHEIFVLVSDDESFGIAAAEAMAAGCSTVVSANVGLAAEAEASGALIVASQDPGKLADAIARGSARQPDLSETASAYAFERFTDSAVALRMASLYQEILSC